MSAGRLKALLRLRDGDYIVETDSGGYKWLLGADERAPYRKTVAALLRDGLIEKSYGGPVGKLRTFYFITDKGRLFLDRRQV